MNQQDGRPQNVATTGSPSPGDSNPARGSWLFLGPALGWVAFVLLHRLASGRWWLWLAPDLLPPLTFAVVPLLLLVLATAMQSVRFRGGVLGCAALAAGAGLNGLNLHALAPNPAPASPDALRILSWNTAQWNHSNDANRFYRLLRAYNADIYLLQEYKPYDRTVQQEADLSRLRRYFTGYHIATIGELITASRFPIAAVKILPTDPLGKADWRRIRRYPPGPRPPINLPTEVRWRTWPSADGNWPVEYWSVKAIRADLKIGKRLLSVYNVHIPVPLHTTTPFSATFYEYRKWYLKRRSAPYRSLCSDVATNRLPMLVAGDFNTSPGMRNGCLQRLTGRLQDAARANRSLYPASWPADRLPLWRLDWAFSSPSLQVHHYRFRDPGGMSDHRIQDLKVSLQDTREEPASISTGRQ